MPSMRVFLPASSTMLARWAAAGQVSDLASAHAVTPALRSWLGEQADLEELEYVALGEAAETSLRLLAADDEASPRRIVLAADVEMLLAPAGRPDAPHSLVSAPDPVPLRRVVSVLVDDDDALAAVRRATAALRAGVGGDELDELTDAAAGFELMWYDVSEIGQVLGLVAPR